MSTQTISPPKRPILFSAPLVRAILAGDKTQTRRVVKDRGVAPDPVLYDRQPVNDGNGMWRFSSTIETIRGTHRGPVAHIPCPYGSPGDRLWVREAFRLVDAEDKRSPSATYQALSREMSPSMVTSCIGVRYEADETERLSPAIASLMKEENVGWGRLRPSIHMPHWASRIELEVVDVRVERLKEITEADAEAEGVEAVSVLSGHGPLFRDAFEELWDEINASRGYGWDVNPWVWVVEFRRVAT